MHINFSYGLHVKLYACVIIIQQNIFNDMKILNFIVKSDRWYSVSKL